MSKSRFNLEKSISEDPSYVSTRKETIIHELDNLREQRNDLPALNEIDKRDKTNNFQNHLELSTQINELEMEMDELNAI